MALSRYARASIIDYGSQYGTSKAVNLIRTAVSTNSIKTERIILRDAERLDTLAGSIYGDSKYWWILAAASNIGWGMQIPPGTVIYVPNLADISMIVG